MTTLRLLPKDFKPGDRTTGGLTIIGYTRIGKGGWGYEVERSDGSRVERMFDARRKWEIERNEA